MNNPSLRPTLVICMLTLVAGCAVIEEPISPAQGCAQIKEAINDVCEEDWGPGLGDDVVICEELTVCGSKADRWDGVDVDAAEDDIRGGTCDAALDYTFEIKCEE